MAELEPMLFPEITSEVTTEDKWGTELRYVPAKDGQSYRLISAGADATFDEASWTKKGKLASADDDAVLENGELVRQWTEETQPGLGPRAKLQPKAREQLARADARLQAGDHAGALNAYMEAVKADRTAADLAAIRAYAPPAYSLGAPAPGAEPPPEIPAAATAAHIAALRQFLTIEPGHADAERELVLVLPDGEAVAYVSDMLKRRPQEPELYRLRSQLRFRTSHYVEGLADLEHAAKLDSGNAKLFYMAGVAAYEIAAKYSGGSTPEQKRDIIRRGLDAFGRAESLRADYFESLTYRQLLLREQAKLESDPAIQQKLIAEADAVRQRAVDLIKARRDKAATAGANATPATPPAAAPAPAGGSGPYRVGGDVKAPLVRRRVDPVIPEAARKARVSGIVIVEVVIDREGKVSSTNVLKPLPFGLSEAAVEAVKQWTFAPGTLNGQPVDVVFNLTVNMQPE
ncbi:MAG TPA: TonB family protein, partial [Thermoanaerobaculia bacterium]